ncbi:MAG: PIG-L family deacetylase [Bacteroidota bacterium]
MKPQRNVILVVASHPDDEVLGCGGAMAQCSERGDEVHVLILGEGLTSRQLTRSPRDVKTEMSRLHKQVASAARRLGAASAEVLKFPDNRFDSVDLLDLVHAVESKKREVKPTVVYTHHRGDLNVDHQRTFEATVTACRPMKGEVVREIYSFEVPSSTEWQVPTASTAFLPTRFMVLEERHIKAKVEAMELYSSERRAFPHPRSAEGLRTLAAWRGVTVGANYAECFEVVRQIL